MPEGYEGAGYIRRSYIRRGREHETISPELQERAIGALAGEIGASGVRYFRDLRGHRSGRSTKDRPEWVRLKEYLKAPQCSFLMIYMLDRAARNVREISELIELCKQYGKRLITVYDHIDTDRTGFTAEAIADINMRAVFAQLWSDKTSDLMVATAKEFRTELRIPWGMWPFGFARVGKGSQAKLTPEQPHCETVRTLLTWYAAGLSYDAVSQRLNDNQYRHLDRHRDPKRFTRESVRSVVGNILFYAGYIIVQRWKAKEARIELAGDPGSGTYLERYAQHMKALRSPAIEPLVASELADAVIERRYKNQITGRKSLTYVFLLTPIAFYDGQKLRGDSRDFGYFYCTRRAGIWIDAERVDQGLVERLSRVQFPPELREIVRARVAERTGDTWRRETRERIALLEHQLETLIDLLLANQIKRESYNVRYTELERALRDARADLSKEDDVDRLMAALTDMSKAIQMMTPANQKRALHKLFERVDFNETGEIMRLHLREWARYAFGEIVFAMRTTPTMPPVSIPHVDGVAWFIDIAA